MLNLPKPGEAATGPGAQGKYTGSAGFMAYYEICDKINKKGWTVKYNDNMKSPFVYGDGQWCGYENKQSLAHRCNIINKVSFTLIGIKTLYP